MDWVSKCQALVGRLGEMTKLTLLIFWENINSEKKIEKNSVLERLKEPKIGELSR